VVFQLPAPELGGIGETRTLALGEKVSMDELGPIIINPDGTMRRIANWNELTKGEQESTLRQISARNKKRIQALKEAELQKSLEKSTEKESCDSKSENTM
jgi:predicted Fe-S protein YdhL (DUF1289 family)